MPLTDKRLIEMIQEIDDDGKGLTKWEVNFIGDMIDKNINFFSFAQAGVIERIYDQRMR